MSEQLTAEIKQLRNRMCAQLAEPRSAPLDLHDGVAILDMLAKVAVELEMLEGKPDGVLAW